MTAIEIILSIISVVGTASSILFAYLAFRRNERTDNKKDGKSEGEQKSDDHIKNDSIHNTGGD